MPKKNYVPAKNYIVAFAISLFAILFTYYIFSWYKIYQEKQFNESYLMKSNTISLEVNDIHEIKSTFTEAPSEYFVYIGYRNDKKVYQFERELKKVIDKYNLNDMFYYIDITELKEEENFIDKINDALGLTENKIAKVPTIVYFKDGIVSRDAIITREDDNLIEVGDFEKMLDIFEIKK